MGNRVLNAVGGKFTGNGVRRSAHAGAFRVPALNHKAVDDPVEGQSVVKAALCQSYEI